MATRTIYHLGGYKPAAPQQNRAELYDGATATYTSWDTAGVQTAQRPLTLAEVADFAAVDAADVKAATRSTIQQLASAALPANRTDQTQDATIQSGAATIGGTAGPFTLAQCTTFIKQLAQAVSTLAGNDVNAKKELNLLIRLGLELFDATN